MNSEYQRGFEAGAEDRAIGATFEWPDESLSKSYQIGYKDGWDSEWRCYGCGEYFEEHQARLDSFGSCV